MDRSLSLFSVNAKLLIRITFENSVHEFVRTNFELDNCKENMTQLEKLLEGQNFKSIHFRYEGKEHLRMNAWIFIVSLIKKFKFFEQSRNLKFGIFIRQDEKFLNEWNHHVCTNTLEILKQSQLEDWDFLIDLKHSSSNFIGGVHLEALYEALEDIQSEYFRLQKFFLVISANVFLEPFYTHKIARCLSHLNPSIESLGLMMFDAGSEKKGYDAIFSCIGKFSKLNELMFVLVDCCQEDIFKLEQCLTRPQKKPIKNLRLYTVWNEMSNEGASCFLNIIFDLAEQLVGFGWAIWDENPTYEYRELFTGIFEALGRKSNKLSSLKCAVENSLLETNFVWETLLLHLVPIITQINNFGFFFDKMVNGDPCPLLLLSKMKGLTNLASPHEISKSSEFRNTNTKIIRHYAFKRSQMVNRSFALWKRADIKSIFKRKLIAVEILEFFL